MAPRSSIRAPTNSSIPNALKVPSTTRSLVKSLSRLSRDSLIKLALEWLEGPNLPICAPYLACNRDLDEEAEEDYLHTPAESIQELRYRYRRFKTEPGTRREMVNRILDGDWRRGISLQQLAMIDFRHLEEHEASLRWTALKLVPLGAASKEMDIEPLKEQRKSLATEPFPRMHPSAFVQALKHEISPLVKAHYYLHRLPAPHSLAVLRLYVADTPYANPISSTQAHFTDSARTLFIAFPDSCPYVYVALSGSGGGGGGNANGAAMPKVDITALKRTVLEAIPKALSRPQQRFALEATALTAKNLDTMCSLRGNGRGGASQGSYSIFTDASAENGPLSVVKPSFESKVYPPDENYDESEIRESSAPLDQNKKRKFLTERDSNVPIEAADDRKRIKKRKLDVAKRFGTTGAHDSKHRAPIDRLQIRLEADFASTEDEDPDTTSDADANALVYQSTTNAAKRKTKVSVLDAFDPHKNGSRPQPKAPRSYLTQYSSNAHATTRPHTAAALTLTFHGTDVFAGIRTLAEMGFVDLDQMPAWMTGEEGVSAATVRNGVAVDGKAGGA